MTASSIPPALADRDGLAVIGRTIHDLRGIRFEEGTGGAAPAAPAEPAEPAEPAAPAPAATPAAPTVPAADPLTVPVGDVPFDQLPPATQAEVRRLRQADLAWRQERTQLQGQVLTPEQRAAVAAAIGLQSGEQLTPEQLAQQTATRAAELESSLAAEKRANMVLLTAQDAGANANLLLDSRGFTESIAGLDPNDRAAIQTAITTWLQAHPEHKTQPGTQLPPSSGPTRQQGATTGAAKPGLEGAIAGVLAKQTPTQ